MKKEEKKFLIRSDGKFFTHFMEFIKLMEGRKKFLEKELSILEKKVYEDRFFEFFQLGIKDQIEDEICFLESLLEKEKQNGGK